MKEKIEKILLKVQKPARYTGGELNSVIKDKNSVDIRYAFCFPDSYEIGMSHLGMKILYSHANRRADTWCERVFAPWGDMEALMRENGVPLFALESTDSVRDFDLIGFTLQYELSYTNILNMLDLAGVPLFASDRECWCWQWPCLKHEWLLEVYLHKTLINAHISESIPTCCRAYRILQSVS